MSDKKPLSKTLIPESILDVQTQRWYYLGLGALLQVSVTWDSKIELTNISFQACKAVDVISSFLSLENRIFLFQKWLLLDTAYCVLLAFLRIPRLNYSKAIVTLQIISLCLFDGLIFGGIRVNIWGEGSIVTTGSSGEQ